MTILNEAANVFFLLPCPLAPPHPQSPLHCKPGRFRTLAAAAPGLDPFTQKSSKKKKKKKYYTKISIREVARLSPGIRMQIPRGSSAFFQENAAQLSSVCTFVLIGMHI